MPVCNYRCRYAFKITMHSDYLAAHACGVCEERAMNEWVNTTASSAILKFTTKRWRKTHTQKVRKEHWIAGVDGLLGTMQVDAEGNFAVTLL